MASLINHYQTVQKEGFEPINDFRLGEETDSTYQSLHGKFNHEELVLKSLGNQKQSYGTIWSQLYFWHLCHIPFFFRLKPGGAITTK